MREAVTLFAWLLILVVAAAVVARFAMAVFDYIFVPMPYHDPEPFITPPSNSG